MDRRGDRAPAATEDAERAGAIVAEQIRAITEAVEHRAGEVRHDAEAAAGTIEEEGRDAARRVFDRIDRIETAMQHAIRSLRQEADALSRLVGRGPPVRGESPSASTPGSGTLALEPGTDPVEGGSFAGAPAREADLEPASVEATELDAEGAGEPPIVDPESEALPAEAPPASEIAPPLEPESLALEPEESLPADEPLPLEPEESLPPEEPLPIEPDEASAEAPETPAVSEAGGISTIEPEAGEPVPVDGEESLPPAALEPEIVAEGRDDPFEPGESEDVPPDLAEPPLEPEEPGPLEPSGR